MQYERLCSISCWLVRRCERVIQAAEARAKRAGLMLSGPRKLGGSVTGLTPREACFRSH